MTSPRFTATTALRDHSAFFSSHEDAVRSASDREDGSTAAQQQVQALLRNELEGAR